jgi:lipopolysaccharide transport system ATP-binding protein
MSAIAIEATSLSKAYNLGEAGWRSLFGRPSEKFWALRDVSFQIREQEAIGIVGANGAGKSTLLKVLSRVTAPTSGRARVRGRMGTILEVGTGFHPELTGRENVYLSGTILGMTKGQIDRRFDEIVAFAGVEKFVDTPVKRYSSGMYVRLAFAVAAHLDPDILIVDEVLAVGDIGFQKKCLAKMDSSIQQEGRTIIFVSHNMQAIRSLCTRALLLKEGQLVADGPVTDILQRYATEQAASLNLEAFAVANRLNRARGHVRITHFSIGNPSGSRPAHWSLRNGDPVEFRISYRVHEPVGSLAVSVGFSAVASGEILTSIRQSIRTEASQPGEGGEITLRIPRFPLTPGEFAISLALGNADFSIVDDLVDANVHLPHLTVEPAADDPIHATGLFSLDYDYQHVESARMRSDCSQVNLAS